MRTDYALQFDLHTEAPLSCMESIQGRVRNWIEEKYRENFEIPVVVPSGEGLVEPLDNHVIRTSYDFCDSGRLMTLEWIYPDDFDLSMRRSVLCTLAADGEALQLAFLLRLFSARFVVRPVGLDVHRPEIVTEIVQAYPWTVGGTPVPSAPVVLDALGVGEFVARTLLDPRRLLPVILVSPDPRSERPVLRPELIQERLCGLACVAVLQGREAAFQFREHLGDDLSCSDGAVRLYWPGLTRGATPAEHPIYLAERITYEASQGNPLEQSLLRTVAAVAAFRYVDGTTIRKVRSDIAALNSAQTEQIRRRLQEQSDEYNAFLEEFEQLENQRDELRSRVAELEDKLAAAEQILRVAWKAPSDERQGAQYAEITDEPKRPKFRSVLEALEAAERENSDILTIWKSAQESAEDCHSNQIERVFWALTAIAEIGRERFATRASGRSMGRWDDAFTARGLKYSPTEAQITRTKYRESRIFNNGSKRQQMFRHITLPADRTNGVQIYFEPDDDLLRIDVGYCGIHLEYHNQHT